MTQTCAYTDGTVRKKPTNLTLADAIRSRAERIMARQGFTSFSAFVEQLIREEHSRQFPDTLNDTAQPPTTHLNHMGRHKNPCR